MKSERTPSALGPWGTAITFAEGECRAWRLHRSNLWVERRSGEWRIAFVEGVPGGVEPAEGTQTRHNGAAPGRRRGGASGPRPGEGGRFAPSPWGTTVAPPADLSWLRFVAGEGREITLLPALPDRPVVVRPRSPIAILAGRSARFYIRLPVWATLVEGRGSRRQLIAQHPIERLSNTWFGTPDNGELCYAFASPLATAIDEGASAPFEVVCPVAIRNEASEDLDFQRICVRVQYLGLYVGESRLATNEVIFHFRGRDQTSQITFGEGAPGFEAAFKRIAEPRSSPVKGLIQKSFEYIKFLTT